MRRLRGQRGEDLGEPRPQPGTKGLLALRVAQVHGRGLRSQVVEPEEPDGVAPDDLAARVVVETRHLALGDLLGVRPGGVRVRVVRLVGDVVGTDLLEPSAGRGRRRRNSRRSGGGSRSTAAREPCRRPRPSPGSPPTPCRPAPGCRGSSRSGPRSTPASGSGTGRGPPRTRSPPTRRWRWCASASTPPRAGRRARSTASSTTSRCAC